LSNEIQPALRPTLRNEKCEEVALVIVVPIGIAIAFAPRVSGIDTPRNRNPLRAPAAYGSIADAKRPLRNGVVRSRTSAQGVRWYDPSHVRTFLSHSHIG
jgi:hypothetical protein